MLGLSVYQSHSDTGEALLHFQMNVAGGAPVPLLPPQAVWFLSFQAPTGLYGVRAQTDDQGTPTYFSYVVAGNLDDTIYDGRFVQAGSEIPAVEGSGPDADGILRIVVRAADVGAFDAGDVLIGFNAASLQSALVMGTGAAFTLDEAPVDLVRGPEQFEVLGEDTCGSNKSSGLADALGGALGVTLLLPLGLAALRRRMPVPPGGK